MALRCFEGFDATAPAEIPDKISSQTGVPGSTGANIATTSGIYGYGLAARANVYPWTLTCALDNQPTLYVCFHAAGDGNFLTFALMDGATQQVYMSIVGGLLRLYNGSGALLATSELLVNRYIWRYFEFSCTVHNTAGACRLKLDGQEVWNISGVNTRNSANNYANAVTVGTGNTNTTNDGIDNLVIMDGTGSSFNSFQGEMRVAAVLPNAAGTYAQFTPLSGANYAQVDQSPDDGDASYVASSTPGNLDSYNFTDVASVVGSLLSVMVTAVARKDDVGTRTLSLTARESGTDYVGSNVGTVGSGYSPVAQRWDTNDPAGNLWTVTNFNAMEFGVKQVT
jgi:hypothetical protein